MTPEELAAFVGATPDDAEYVAECSTQAVELVNSFIGSAEKVAAIPAAVLDRCYLNAGSELFHQRNAPNGISQFASFDGSALRVPRDPLVGVYPLLKNHMVMGL